jgi:predicted RNase H-like nuclease (RuvC/YqgF family)
MVKTIHQQVKLLGKQHEQMSTEAKNTKESMTTLEARVNDMRHEQNNLKDNECTKKENIHSQIVIVNKKMMENLGKDLEDLRLDFNTMKVTGLNSSPSFKHNEGPSSPTRSSSGNKELRSTVNTKTTTRASTGEISIPF